MATKRQRRKARNAIKRFLGDTYNPRIIPVVRAMCQGGAVDHEVSDALGVSVTTYRNWVAQHPDLREATALGEEAANERVKRSLFQRANGYSFDEEEIFNNRGQIVRAKTIKHVPPDQAAQSLWLRNRLPNEWRDKRDSSVEMYGKEGAPPVNLQVMFVDPKKK